MAAKKRSTAKENAEQNRKIARGEVSQDTQKLIDALRRSRGKEGNLPAKNARIDARLEALGVTA